MNPAERPHVDGLGRVVVVVPTYNEADNLAWIVGRLRAAQPAIDVLVVDDGSPDGTGAIADELAAADPAVRRRAPHRQGRPRARRTCTASGSRSTPGYDVIGEMDADGSHQPEQLDRLLDALRDGADLVIGSRWVPGGSVVNWPLRRELLSRGGNLYVRAAARREGPRRDGGLPPVPAYDAGEDRPRRGASPPATSSRPTWSRAPSRPG